MEIYKTRGSTVFALFFLRGLFRGRLSTVL